VRFTCVCFFCVVNSGRKKTSVRWDHLAAFSLKKSEKRGMEDVLAAADQKIEGWMQPRCLHIFTRNECWFWKEDSQLLCPVPCKLPTPYPRISSYRRNWSPGWRDTNNTLMPRLPSRTDNFPLYDTSLTVSNEYFLNLWMNRSCC
jgi:hypothetical protein